MKQFVLFAAVFLLGITCSQAQTAQNRDIAISSSFCTMLAQYPDNHVIRAKFLQEIDHGVIVEVLEVYRGYLPEKKITIWDGEEYRYYSAAAKNLFGLGLDSEESILILFPVKEIWNPWDQIGDYRNLCGDLCVSHLIRLGNDLSGTFKMENLDGRNVYELPIEDFLQEAKQCVEEWWEPVNIVYDQSSMELKIDGVGVEVTNLTIWNLLGQQVGSLQIESLPTTFPASHLAAGVYVANVQYSEGVTVPIKIQIY